MASDKECRSQVANIVLSITFVIIIAIIGSYAFTAKPNGLRLVVVGGSFQMDEFLQGNVTLQFTLRAKNPTSSSITYKNISGTLMVLNVDEYGDKDDHFLRFPVTDFDVRERASADSPTQVNATRLGIDENNIAVVLQLNGTMEKSSRNSSAGYRCHIRTSKDDQACSRMKQPIV